MPYLGMAKQLKKISISSEFSKLYTAILPSRSKKEFFFTSNPFTFLKDQSWQTHLKTASKLSTPKNQSFSDKTNLTPNLFVDDLIIAFSCAARASHL
jgi:hypothetical protein